MKFARVRTADGTRPVMVAGEESYDLSGLLGDLTPETIKRLDEIGAAAADGRLGALAQTEADQRPSDQRPSDQRPSDQRPSDSPRMDLPRIDLSGAVFEAPIGRPGAVLAIGMNYAAHAAESGAAPPPVPVLFLKTPNTVAAPDEAFVLPARARKLDWEVELALVIKKRAWELGPEDDPMDYVAGFTVADDLSERTFQLEESGGQWSKGKCLPGSTPLGPWLVTPDAVDPVGLRLRSFVNGEPRQDSTTADMIFDVPTIIRHLSQYLVLEAGDVVLTGTPQGVALSGRFPYLVAGDEVRIEIDGLGIQTHRIVGADTAAGADSVAGAEAAARAHRAVGA